VRPGLPGGRYKPLTEADMQQVYDNALRPLAEVGMGSPIDEFVSVVTAAGGRVDSAGRLRYPRGVVKRAISTAAKEWVWHGFDDDHSIIVGGDRVHFGTAGAAVLMHDHATNTFRHTTAADVYDCARLVDTLDNIHFYVRTVVARDVADARELDINTAFAAMTGTSKPIGTSWFGRPQVYDTVDMFDMALGGPGEFRKRPFVAANNTFVVPPLRFAEDSVKAMVAQVETGMPINLLSAGQAGATSPAALLDRASLARAAADISDRAATPPPVRLPTSEDTVYLSSADASGMMVSFIQSNFHGFGAGIVIPGTGIAMQNRGAGFTLAPGHPNQVGPAKRPFHTIIPGFVTGQGAPLLSCGGMGGHMEPQGQVQMVRRICAHGQNPQAASDAPRWHVHPHFSLGLEPGFNPEVAKELATRGHRVRFETQARIFGGAQLILKTEHGYIGGSDHRKEGLAAGF